MRNTLSKPLAVLALVAGLSLATSRPASAVGIYPEFTVNQTLISNCLAAGIACSFQADVIAGSYTERFTVITNVGGTGTFSTVAYFNTNSFNMNDGATPIILPPSMLNTQLPAIDGYDIYAIFAATGTFSPLGGTGVQFSATTGCVDLYVDRDVNTSPAGLPGAVGPAPTCAASGITFPAGTTADDSLLGSATLASGEGHLFPSAANGDFSLAFNPFVLTPLGAGVFTQPVPFYLTAILEGNFNNFTPGAAGSSETIGGVANAFFPEPASLALFGIGLLGSSLAVRRRKAQK
jgi:hypothetical protein